MKWGIILLLAAAQIVAAEGMDKGPRFGPEFTFDGRERRDAFVERLHAHLYVNQPEGEKFIQSGFTFRSPHGWRFTVGQDPGVVEVTMNPMTVGEIERFAGDIQDAIFVTAGNMSMFPKLYGGGGHINVDIGYFAMKPPVLLRNFIVDTINHCELGLGILNYDTNNALSFTQNPQMMEHLRRVIQRFDEGGFGDIQEPSAKTLDHFLGELENFSTTDVFRPQWSNSEMRSIKGMEMSFSDSLSRSDNRLEIRAVRPQASADVWLRQIKLIRDRIFFLERNFTTPIPWQPWYQFDDPNNVAKYQLNPPISAENAFQHFYQYVKESGHNWSDHRDYLWPAWIYRNSEVPNELSELEKFEGSEWFLSRERKHLPVVYDPGPKFGPEFTFANPTGGSSMFAILGRMMNHLVEGQPEGAKFRSYGYRFDSPNGWTVLVTEDPGVVEIKMHPMTADRYRQYSADIQDAIFVSAANVGHFPQHYLGGGHINVDVNYFRGKPPMLVRNFIVDWLNHSELSLGILSYDSNNAVPLSFSQVAQTALPELLQRFDSGSFGDPLKVSPQTVNDFLQALHLSLDGSDSLMRALWGTGSCSGSIKCSLALDSSYVGTGTARIEIRAVRPQASADVWTRQIELIRDRIRYLENNFPGPIPYRPHFTFPEGQDVTPYKLDPPMPAQEALRHFYLFVSESGHKWSDHRDYLWPKWIYRQTEGQKTELEIFESSEWFLNAECRRFLRAG